MALTTELDAALEVAAGFASRAGDEWPGVAAMASEGLVAVAYAGGGHGTAWLAARRVIRAITPAQPAPSHVGAAGDESPGPAYLRGDEPERFDLAEDLTQAFGQLQPVLTVQVSNQPRYLPVECSAARIQGTTLRGAHAGACRVVLLRAGTTALVDVVAPHVLRLGEVTVVTNSLGMGDGHVAQIDRFEVTLSPGDVVVFASRLQTLSDETLATLIRNAAQRPIAELVRSIEFAANTEIALALIRSPAAATVPQATKHLAFRAPNGQTTRGDLALTEAIRWIESGDASFWSIGSGDAAIEIENPYDPTQLEFYFDGTSRFQLRFYRPSASRGRIAKTRVAQAVDGGGPNASILVGGNPLSLKGTTLLDRNTVVRAAQYVVAHGQPDPSLTWR